MAPSDISRHQPAKLCNRCACLQPRSTTPDAILSRNPAAREQGGEQEVDLDWNTTDLLRDAFYPVGDNCDCCPFLRDAIRCWLYEDDLRRRPFTAEPVHVSLHYVFRLDETDGYGLRALRIRVRLGGDECHVDCPVTAATGHDVGTFLRLQPPLSHLNEETMTWMKSKLESCLLHDHVNPDKTFIPDRLIDVRENRLRLVLTKDFQPRDAGIQQYIALTYSWGPEPHASQQLKTTSGNISQHQQRIPECSLPQVIKDAVAVTRAFSIPFLWVDALCILQDDGSDWDKQCAVMERIYGNAYVTVAAASSSNCEEGFIKQTAGIVLPSSSRSDDSRVFRINRPPRKSWLFSDLRDSPWVRRGWTFQERIASTRILIFSELNIHFKCASFSESMGRKQDMYEEYQDYVILDRGKIESGSAAAIYEEWNKVITQVNHAGHQFTRETDLFPSIAGIAALFSKKLEDTYAAGLWKNTMHQSLCWIILSKEKISYRDLLERLRAPYPYIAPSWSWASKREYISFKVFGSLLSPDFLPGFDSLDTRVTLRGESVFGAVTNAALDTTSTVYVGSPRITLSSSQRVVLLDGRYFAHFKPDCSANDMFEPCQPHTLTEPISFLLIGSTTKFPREVALTQSTRSNQLKTLHGDAEARPDYDSASYPSMCAGGGGDLKEEPSSRRIAYGLLIHPTGNPNEYYRVGAFFSKPYEAGGLSNFEDIGVKSLVRLV